MGTYTHQLGFGFFFFFPDLWLKSESVGNWDFNGKSLIHVYIIRVITEFTELSISSRV